MATARRHGPHLIMVRSHQEMAFLKIAWKEPTPELRARYFAKKKEVVTQLLVFSLKPMTAEKKAQGLVGEEYEKARICLQGHNHEGPELSPQPTPTRALSDCS